MRVLMVGVLKNIKKMETTIKKITKEYLHELKSIEHSEGDILQIVPPAIKLLELNTPHSSDRYSLILSKSLIALGG
jgi:hypothetical protein